MTGCDQIAGFREISNRHYHMIIIRIHADIIHVLLKRKIQDYHASKNMPVKTDFQTDLIQ